MKRKTRKHWALVLVFALIAGMLPMGNPSSVSAEGVKNPVTDGNGVTTWDCVYFGSYLQSDTNKDNIVDEKDDEEPIRWRVLSVEGNDAFLMADRNLDLQKFDEDGRNDSVTWENCALRTWLNHTFYNKAFTETEQTAVIKTTVDTAGPSLIITEDNVYLLADDEMKKAYGFTGTAGNASKTREAKNTEYVKQSITANEIEGYEGNGSWWLRSKNNVSDLCADYVNYQGKITYDTFISDFGVRPVLHLDLSSTGWRFAGAVSSNETEPQETAAPSPEVTQTAEPQETAISSPEATALAGPAVAVSNPKIMKNDKMESGQEVTWDSVYFGSYPQAEIIDTEISKNYAAVGSAYLKEGDLIVDDDLYRDLLTAPNDNWNDNGDITLKGHKYRRIQKGDAVSSQDGEKGYYNWPDSVTYHYFKYEPIRWRVLSAEGNRALLLSDIVLDNQHYQVEKEGIGGLILLSTTWEKSCLRSWMNGYNSSFNSSERDYGSRNFIDSAFTDREKAAVMDTPVTTGANSKYNTSGGADTTDKVFLLSEQEVCGTEAAQKYGFASDAGTYDEARGAKSSTYTKAMGLSWDVQSQKYAANSMWWLRTRGEGKSKFMYVGNWGKPVLEGFGSDYYFGVRPALYINLSAVSPESIRLAGTVNSGGGAAPTPAPSAAPPESAGPTGAPVSTPSASGTPAATPSVKPGQQPESSAKPSQKPVQSAKPEQKPASSVKPGKQPESSAKPGQQPVSTAKPGQQPAAVTRTAPVVAKIRSLKAKPGKKRLTVTWKTVSGVDGYQIQVGMKKNFKGAKKFSLRASKKKYVVKKLKARKKYYIRIRAFKYYTDASNTRQTAYGKWKKLRKKTK